MLKTYSSSVTKNEFVETFNKITKHVARVENNDQPEVTFLRHRVDCSEHGGQHHQAKTGTGELALVQQRRNQHQGNQCDQ